MSHLTSQYLLGVQHLSIVIKLCYTIIVPRGTTNRRRKTPQTGKANAMKKASLKSLVSFINGEAVENIADIKAEIEAELAKGEAKAQVNRDLYAKAEPIVLDGLRKVTAPVTINELFGEIEKDLPANFTKNKVQYGLTRLWADKVVKTEGKVNTYIAK